MWFLSKTLRRLRRLPVTELDSVASGERVRVSGVAGTTSLVSPITRSPCTLFQLELREWDNGLTYPFLTTQHGIAFQLNGRHGDATIDCERALAKLRLHASGHSSWGGVDPRVANHVTAHGHSMLDRWGTRRSLDWREHIIAPGDHICVVGVASHESAPGAQPYRNLLVRVVIRAELIADRKSCGCS